MEFDLDLLKLLLDGGAVAALALVVWKLGGLVDSAQKAQASSFDVLRAYFESEMRQSAAAIETLRNGAIQTKSELEKTKEELRKTRALIEAKDMEIRDLKSQLKRLRDADKTKTERLETQQKRIETLQCQIKQVQTERDELKSRLNALETKQAKEMAAKQQEDGS